MAQTELEVKNAHGLHARPAALFVQKASQFSSSIILRNLSRGSKEANAKSIMDVLMAGVDQGARIELVAEGEDAERAVEALTDLVRSGLEGA
ncbi:MAG: HPr family phosphocarrier protein [Chloroflexi bacterium]|nr:HPr family phosphocarrier protein [Chloroflexota bacterium]